MVLPEINTGPMLALLWRDFCTVMTAEKVTDPVTKQTAFVEHVLLEGLPCKLSFSTLAPSGGSPTAAVTQTVMLFLAPEVNIPPGSKIVVTRPTGHVMAYRNSGQAGIFSNHQEIPLVLFDRWA